jgi:predicted PurR-regulated permease PerM
MRAVPPQETDIVKDLGQAQEISYVEKALGLGLLLILLSGCVLVLYPFLSAILLAIPLCVSTWPLFTRLQRQLAGRRTVAALVMTVAIASLLVVPLVLLGGEPRR